MKTKQENTDQQLEEITGRDEQFNTIFKNAPNAFVVINDKGNIINWNPEAEKMFGFKTKEVLGKPMHELIMPEKYRTAHLQGFSHFIKTGEGPVLNKLLELSAVRKNKEEFPIELRISTCLQNNKNIFIAFIIDITVRKNIELANQKLLQDLEKANSNIEIYSFSITHDLRSPLRIIKNFSNILHAEYKNKLDEKGIGILNIIISETKKMESIIQELLTLARIGKKAIQKSTVKMKDIAQGCLKELLLTNLYNKTTINIVNMPEAYCDISLIQYVFINLISNALKFSGNNPEAKIEIGCNSKNGENIYYIKDNGVGFDMTYYDKLFGLFQRLHSQEEFEGVGVGLVIAHKIIEMHKGKIWAESKVDKGATFYFTLPNNG